MPIYEYRCEKCDREFEVEQRITDPPLGACPKCRSRKVRRLISQTSFVLKGGGWYSDIYSSKSSSKPDADKGSAKEGGGDVKESKDPASPTKPDSTPSKGGEGPGGKKGKGKKPESKSAA